MANNEPTVPGEIQPQNTRALVMTAPWSLNDTDQSVPAYFRNKIPGKYKKDGIFHLGTGAEGFFVDEKNGWARALFFRENNKFPVLVPMSRVKIGAKWRPWDVKMRESRETNSTDDGLPPLTHINAQTRLERHIRILWLLLRQRSFEMRRLGLEHSQEQQIFGENFNNHVDLIVRGFTRESRQLFSNGITDANQLASLRMASKQWPIPGTIVIYARLYRERVGGRPPGVYVGQTIRHAWVRHLEHEAAVGSRGPHYDVARQSAPQDRLMIPIIVWDMGESISTETLNMAEQTLMLMLGTYHGWIRTPGVHEHVFNQFSLLNAVNTSARQVSGWPLNNAVGTNINSPVFAFHRNPPIHCYRERTEVTGLPAMSLYRQARMVPRYSENHSGARFSFTVERSNGTTEKFEVLFPGVAIPAETPGYIVFEIMHSGRPHAFSYLGCPTIGPFEDFGIASSLAIAFEWRENASNQWKKCYTRSTKFRGAFSAGLSDPAKSLGPWKRCMEWIQILEGIDYTGNRGFFSKSLRLKSTDINELVFDHLSQKAKWQARPRQSKSAPKPALFVDNAQLMANLTSTWSTVTNITNPPPLTSSFWRRDQGDTQSASKMTHATCDFCKYMVSQAGGQGRYGLVCERDTKFTDQWVCKSCALLRRPCSWTARSHNIEYWGEGPPYLGASKYALASYPTGPHKYLAFYQSFPGGGKVVDTVEPIDGLDGLIILQDTLDHDGESPSLEGDENGDDV